MNYIIITGASRGLGKSLALKLGKANTKLYLLARDLKKLQDISIEVRNNGGEVETIEFDLIPLYYKLCAYLFIQFS